MTNGARPTRINHLDFDYFKTLQAKFGATVSTFPTEYLCDSGFPIPNQNDENTQFNPPLPPEPEGCTNYSQASISNDLTGTLHNPQDVENITHANANGGGSIPVALSAAVKLGWFKAYYNIKATGLFDFFDSFRLAQVSSAPEKRSITWGTPWFSSWEQACLAGQVIMPMPTPDELIAFTGNINAFPWHNSKLDGFTTEQNTLVYRDSSWQGTTIGINGFVFFPREVINVVMGLKGTVAYLPTNDEIGEPQTIDVTVVEWIKSFVLNFLGL